MNPILHIDGFEGTARLFPLPDFVMMPHVLKNFHIFEPRYRELVRDSLSKDKLIAMVLPRQGWEKDYEGTFPIYTVGCLASIHEHEKLEDGRYNILLRGLCRIELEHELLTHTLYRQAKVKLQPDPHVMDEGRLRNQLEKEVLPWLSEEGEGRSQFIKLMHSQAPLGTIVDVVSFALPILSDWKQQLLEIFNVPDRVRKLCELLHSVEPFKQNTSNPRKNPPDFSTN
ncbi:MAG: LON peptidase substrate-binding domain-containing protein [Planctomycetia bacterium]|nr:LON peptidase substrate-binding domain-containing protein [Planctomycetia bacterium]